MGRSLPPLSDDDRLPECAAAAAHAYLASFDALLRARTEEQLSDADEAMGRSASVIFEECSFTPRRMPRRPRAPQLLPLLRGTR